MKNRLFQIFFAFVIFLVMPSGVSAQTCSPTQLCPAGKACVGSFCVEAAPSLRPEFSQPGAFAFAISRFFTFLLPLVGIIGFLIFLWAGFQYLMSKGDPKALAAAQARLTYAVIGLVIVFLAYSITNYLTGIFGLVMP